MGEATVNGRPQSATVEIGTPCGVLTKVLASEPDLSCEITITADYFAFSTEVYIHLNIKQRFLLVDFPNIQKSVL